MKFIYGFTVGLILQMSPVVAQEQNASFFQNTSPTTYTPLKSGDLIQVIVTGFPELSGEQIITDSGDIYLPMAGEIPVAGLSIEDGIQKVVTVLLPYIRRPQVSIVIVDPAPLRISVTGEVLNPGPRLLSADDIQSERDSAGENSGIIRLSNVLAAAGGIEPTADISNILIRRVAQPRSLEGALLPFNNTETVIEVDLWEVIQTGDLSADPKIYDGDEIFVPYIELENDEQQSLLASTIAPTRILVNVAGEVRNPGIVEVSPTADINAAIAAAGGPTPEADINSIDLLRIGESGILDRSVYQFGEETINVMDGDLIVVKKSSVNGFLDFLGDISNPIRLILDIF